MCFYWKLELYTSAQIHQISLHQFTISSYGIVGHGKGEVDHAGDVAKISMWRKISSGKPLYDATKMAKFLQANFCDQKGQTYNIKETDEFKVEGLHTEMTLKNIFIVEGSASFQVRRFKLDCDVLLQLLIYAHAMNVYWLIMDHVIHFRNIQLTFIGQGRCHSQIFDSVLIPTVKRSLSGV